MGMGIDMGIRGRGHIDEWTRNRMMDTTTNNTEKRTGQEIQGHTTKSQEEEDLYHITTTHFNPQTRHTHRKNTEGGGNQQHLQPRQAIRRRTERARERNNPPRTADETASDRATNPMLYTIELI